MTVMRLSWRVWTPSWNWNYPFQIIVDGLLCSKWVLKIKNILVSNYLSGMHEKNLCWFLRIVKLILIFYLIMEWFIRSRNINNCFETINIKLCRTTFLVVRNVKLIYWFVNHVFTPLGIALSQYASADCRAHLTWTH